MCDCDTTVTVALRGERFNLSIQEKNVELLTDFGLTRNQARVYVAIAQLRLASAGQISKAAKVRREDVYRILPKLEKIGLAERLLGTPVKIRAKPVKEALEILLKQEEEAARERMSTLKAKTDTFLHKFKTAPRLNVEEKSHFALLSERESLISNAFSMIRRAETELDIVFSKSQIMQFIHHFQADIKEVVRKGVKIRVVSEVPDYDDSLPRIIEEVLSPGEAVALRYAYLPSSNYMIVDSKEALIATAADGSITDVPFLWTDSESLIRVFQADFENLWHNSVGWKSIETAAVPEKVINYMEKLRPTNHLIFLYDSPEAKYKVLFNFIKTGLEKNEAGVYVSSDESTSAIRDAMKRFGIDVETCEETGALQVLGYEDVYIINGKFSAATTLNLWNRLYKESLERGFERLRITGELGCFFTHNLIRELIEYEKALHRVLDIPVVAICAYSAAHLNKTKDPVNLYSELARAHGTVLFTGLDNKLGRLEIRRL
jgi:sugar-specific transcriptional regulator TrmB